jgi:hypothetical protein
MPSIFPLLILNGRPAAGKSELIHFLSLLSDADRRARFRIGQLYELDDFPMQWTWLEEDTLLEATFGRPRLHTDAVGYFIHEDLWHLLIVRLGLAYQRLLRDQPDLGATHTVLVEFSRGTEHGGYRAAYDRLSDTILEQAAILYIDVSFEESRRKNRRRFNPDRPDSILEHSVPEDRLARLYQEVDWEQVSSAHPETIPIRDFAVPYVVFPNDDDVTTTLGPVFEARLETALATLWDRRSRFAPRRI